MKWKIQSRSTFFRQINSFLFPCSHLVLVCMHKTFLHSCKIPILYSALKNNCNMVSHFLYCYLVFTTVFNDHVLRGSTTLIFPLLLHIYRFFKKILIRKNILVNTFMYKTFSFFWITSLG